MAQDPHFLKDVQNNTPFFFSNLLESSEYNEETKRIINTTTERTTTLEGSIFAALCSERFPIIAESKATHVGARTTDSVNRFSLTTHPVYVSAELGCIKILKQLAQRWSNFETTNEKDKDYLNTVYVSALNIAIHNKQHNTVDFLLENRKNKSEIDSLVDTWIFWTEQNDIHYLPSWDHKNKGYGLLHTAVLKDDAKMTEIILKHLPDLIHKKYPFSDGKLGLSFPEAVEKGFINPSQEIKNILEQYNKAAASKSPSPKH